MVRKKIHTNFTKIYQLLKAKCIMESFKFNIFKLVLLIVLTLTFKYQIDLFNFSRHQIGPLTL
jgi:hypothetical protein